VRICSLLPSATEIVCLLDLADQLVGITHACDYPPEVRGKPVVTRSSVDHALPSPQIDALVRQSVHEHRSLYHLDLDRLRALAPDLIITQELCDVCAVSYATVQQAMRLLPGAPQVVSLEPKRLDDVLANIAQVGALTGRAEAAQAAVAALRARIERVAAASAQVAPRPRVVALEWLDPLYTGGHWVPEMIRLAGGTPGLAAEGEPSAIVAWDDVRAFAPEVLVLMPCGFDVARTKAELASMTQRPGWSALPAVRQGRVYAVDAASYFSRPGPRLVDGLELLASILHPERFPLWLSPPGAPPALERVA
jgi:iron complex transport system substrate-binding protein